MGSFFSVMEQLNRALWAQRYTELVKQHEKMVANTRKEI